MVDRTVPVLLVQARATTTKIIADMVRRLGFKDVEMTRDGADALQILDAPEGNKSSPLQFAVGAGNGKALLVEV